MKGIEKKFPIYMITIDYSIDAAPYSSEPLSTAKGKVFRESDRVVIEKMFKEPIEKGSENAVLSFASYNFFNQAGRDGVRRFSRDPQIESRKIELVEFESWVSGWFCHKTMNTHLDDEDILESFHKYVERKLLTLDTRHLLMGADEVARWRPPCRCQACTFEGVVRIDH